MSNTAPSRADPVVVFPLGQWCPPQETPQPHPPQGYEIGPTIHDVNSLWPGDAIWWQRSGSTLAQVMACCLTATNHYLNQCWHIIMVQWHSYEGSFTIDTSAIDISLKITLLEFTLNLPGVNELTCPGRIKPASSENFCSISTCSLYAPETQLPLSSSLQNFATSIFSVYQKHLWPNCCQCNIL